MDSNALQVLAILSNTLGQYTILLLAMLTGGVGLYLRIDDILSDDEIQVLRKVYSDYGGVSGGVLENISHSEAPYNAVVQGEYIPYELAFYRGKSKKELVGV